MRTERGPHCAVTARKLPLQLIPFKCAARTGKEHRTWCPWQASRQTVCASASATLPCYGGYVLHFAACHICTGRLRAQSGDTQQSRRLFQRGVWLVVTDASRLFTSIPPAIRRQWCWHLGRQQDRSDACPIQLCKAEALTCIAPQQGSRTLAAPVCLRPGVPSVHAAAAYMQAMLAVFAGLGCCSLPCLING